MTIFRVLPIERCLELITAWTEAPWPITTEQGWEIARALGWEQDPNHPELFFGELARAEEGDCICNSMDGLTSWVSFPLATWASDEKEEVTAPAIAKRAQQILELLAEIYRKSTCVEFEGDIKSAEWELDSGAAIEIHYGNKVLMATISSPEVVQILNDPRSDPDYERL